MSDDPPRTRQVGNIKVHGVVDPKRFRTPDVNELLVAVDAETDPSRAVARCAFVLFKQTVLYDLNNAALRPPMERWLKQSRPFLNRDGVLSLQRRLDGLYVNNTLVPRDAGIEELYPFLEMVFDRMQVDEIAMLPGLDDDALLVLLKHFQGVMRGTSEIAEYRWPRVHIRTIADERARQARREREKIVNRYALTCVRLAEVLNSFAQGQVPKLVALNNALTGILDVSAEVEPALIACLALPHPKAKAAGHAANTAVLTGLMVKKLGVSRQRMLSSAAAAALHDVGLNLPETQEKAERWRRAIRLMFQVPGQGSEIGIRIAVMRESAFGAPPVEERLAISSLVSIAHAFDLLTAGSETRAPLTMEQSVRVLSGEVGRKYDATAFALLCKTVGFLPPGSLVQLSTGEMAAVVGVPADSRRWLQPPLRMMDAAGAPGDHIDMSVADAGGRSVARSLMPRDVGVNPLVALL